MAVRPRERLLLLALLLLTLCPIFFLSFPTFVPRAFCPSDTFSYGTMWSPFVVIGVGNFGEAGVIVILAAITAWVATAMKPRWRGKLAIPFKLLAPVAGAAVFVGLVIGVILSLSYYCVTPSTILLHPYPAAPARAFTWNDVATVEVTCIGPHMVGRGRNRVFSQAEANLELSLTDGEQIVAQIGFRKSFMAHRGLIQAALAGAGYTGRDVAGCYRLD